MGAALSMQMTRAGSIRRVVRRGRLYICGICRRHFDDLHEAQSCVAQCWSDVLSLDPVIVKLRGPLTAFRCRFCARDFATRGLARQCAVDCRDRRVALEALERELDELDGDKPPRRPRPRPVKLQGVKPPPRPAVKAKAPVAAEAALPNPIAADATAPAAAAPVQSDAAPEGKEKKKKPKDMFYRDGARYVCQVCHAKYFTKDEVVKCFEAHE